MEKRKPSYQLPAIQAAIGTPESLAITISAFLDATSMGFDRARIADVIRSMDKDMFVKSMTTYADHRAWQDVCHVPVDDLVLYVKFQANAVTSFTVMSFKEK